MFCFHRTNDSDLNLSVVIFIGFAGSLDMKLEHNVAVEGTKNVQRFFRSCVVQYLILFVHVTVGSIGQKC